MQKNISTILVEENSSRPRIKLRINELMAIHGIRSVAVLHRILIEKKVAVSHSQLLRIVDNRADHWKVDFLSAFMEIFKCEVGQLFKVTED